MSCFRVSIFAEMSHCRTVKSTILHFMLKIFSSIKSRDSRISSNDSSLGSSEGGASGANKSSLEMSYATKGVLATDGSSFFVMNPKSYAGSSVFRSSKEDLVGSIIEISDSGIFEIEVLPISIPAKRERPPVGFGSS